jgi:outer membrane protein assembly factor BamE (lipoprotein component of BamABCDE complex)
MPFVRVKKFDGRTYYYLVENYREGNRVRQKVLRYLGTEKPSEEELKLILDEIKEEQNGRN